VNGKEARLSMRARTTFAVTAALVALAGCQRDDDQRTDTIRDRDVLAARQQLDPAVTAALDSGNVAYRARDYERALDHYQQAVAADQTLAAGWFGIYMAQLALGNVDAAEAAMAQTRTHAPAASLIRPDPDTGVPGDHPALRDTLP
jgi:tetratricopeptide (TPR) repeat protein